MTGVFTILVTPFDSASRIDEESLRRLVEFNLEAGVYGVGLALGSEIFRLTDDERLRLTRIVVEQTRGRVPVVVNTGGPGTELAVHYSRQAEDAGADALMVMPPTLVLPGPVECREYFKAISDAVTIPIFIQDAPAAPVPAGLARQIAEESERVRYIKVETLPPPVQVGKAVREAGDVLTVFGGAGGSYLLEELGRGSQGTMPSCSVPEAFVEAWNCFRSGDEAGAREVFQRRILPVNRLENLGWSAFYYTNKEILRRRGIITAAFSRGPMAPPDPDLVRDVDALIEQLGF